MTENYPNRIPEAVANAVSEVSPSLDAQETTGSSDFGSSYRLFLTSGIQSTIDFHENVYAALDERDEKKRTQAYNACRSSAWFVRHRVSNEIRVASSRCNLRWCPLCIKTKRYIMLQSLIPWVKNAKKPKFITFTLKHSSSPLEHQIDSLYGYFRLLRKRPYWKSRIKGGIWFFQVTKSENDGLWHPHIHVLCEGRYIPHSELSGIWRDITHGSTIVDTRAVRNPRKAAEYVSRYATAPCKLSSLDLESAVEVVDALAGRRVCGTFGTAKGLQLVPKKCPDADEWEYLAGFTETMLKRHKSDWFKMLYSAFVKNEPFLGSVDPPDKGFSVLYRADGDFIDGWKTLKPEVPSTFEQLVFEWSNPNL